MLISEKVAAYEKIWFFTDEFGSRSFEQFFKSRMNNEGYVKTHFDIYGFTNNMFSENPSVIARFANLMKVATEEKTTTEKRIGPLPKLIVIVPENDIIKVLLAKNVTKGITKGLGRLVNFIMTEHERGISSFKENIPSKSRREGYPHILWIIPPFHDSFSDNQERHKFSKCIEDAAKVHSNVSALELKKVWDPKDDALYVRDQRRFTTEGLKKYWEAVDRTVRYCDSVILKKWGKGNKKFGSGANSDEQKQLPNLCQKDKYRWQNPKFRDDTSSYQAFKKLPTPPRPKRI